MSGCSDVCLVMDYDESNAFYQEVTPRARKPHKCCECGAPIAVGEQYQRATGKADGSIFSECSCLACTEIRKTFCCGSWIFGELWEQMHEQMFPTWREAGPYDCLAKLETERARDKCREEYAFWVGDDPATPPEGK